ncbi:uncharacterized protein LOC121179677 [Toxotes jaculatrix]|uniref:uncharacterized protein LOC121179677 n=1 Tax=Toxotes jaculatrix TaxID=941984 RepID=UPI001B3AEBFF|nr:uncharacterized protein LOC121179677 [Toxotes jaculatrix]
MKMQSRLIFVPTLMLIISASVTTSTTTSATASTGAPWTWTTSTTTGTPWTTGRPAVNLNGMMFTLSSKTGGVSFYPPYYTSQHSPTFHLTTHYPGPTYPPWTTPPSTRGVSVCLRYLSDNLDSSNPTIFTLSPSSSKPLSLRVINNFYQLFDRYYYQYLNLQPSVKLWSGVAPDMWTRLCLTIDSLKNVVQLFSGSNMSVRKILPAGYSWTGEPVLDFPGFDGQVTDIQMWDYPLRYREVIDYMDTSPYMRYRGSVLTWSYISYSLRGKVVLEDVYEMQANQPMSRGGRGRRLKDKKKTRRVFNVSEKRGETL